MLEGAVCYPEMPFVVSIGAEEKTLFEKLVPLTKVSDERRIDISGKIDLALRYPDGTWRIVDYKTDRIMSLIPAGILIVFCSQWMFPLLVGQFLLNLTMPVRFGFSIWRCQDSPGFTFDLAASARWPGTLVGRMMNGQVL